MSVDMSRGPTTERKDEILQAAIELIASEGSVNLSMRALARAIGMELGALQVHFRTWEDLLHALVDFISEAYDHAFEELAESSRSHGPLETVRFLLYDAPGDATLQADRLFPQLWAMAQVEPVMQSLLDEIYRRYLDMLEEAFADAGSHTPRTAARRAGREALLKMVKESGVFRSEAQLLMLGMCHERRSHDADRADTGSVK
jgi:AcrR family transcriptional regulator